jgi:hypothetical protein
MPAASQVEAAVRCSRQLAEGTVRAERLLETAIYGPDLNVLEQFYVELLGLEPGLSSSPRHSVVGAPHRRDPPYVRDVDEACVEHDARGRCRRSA